MSSNLSDRPPEALILAAQSEGFETPTDWALMTGGRTNWLWSCRIGAERVVFKVFRAQRTNVFFPNDVASETASLRALAGSGLAPRLLAEFETPFGPCLAYEFVSGTVQTRTTPSLVRTLLQVHALAAPACLRSISTDPGGILAMGLSLLDGCSAPRAIQLRKAAPAVPDLPDVSRVFLHGDPTPANALATKGGVGFVDWQCPAKGDPTHDLSIALSPAMHVLYGSGPLSDTAKSDALKAYGNTTVVQRFERLENLYRWRMACYCQWMAERADIDYELAGYAELCLD